MPRKAMGLTLAIQSIPVGPQVLKLTGLARWVKHKKDKKTGDEEQGSFGSYASWQALRIELPLCKLTS